MDYYLDFEHRTPKEYQNLLFQLRAAIQQAMETHCAQFLPPEDVLCVAPLPTESRKIHRMVIYTIPDDNGCDNEHESVIFQTPYFENTQHCVQYAISQVVELTWELSHYSSHVMIDCHKPDYIEKVGTTYKDKVDDIRNWLASGLNRPKTLLGDEKESNYFGCCKITEPKHDIDAYIRFDRTEVFWS
jgi:hypothetical protein